jgi:hypothetical protein
MKVRDLKAALDLFDEDADVITRGGDGTFAKNVGLRVSNHKLHKDCVVVEGVWNKDNVDVPKGGE